MKTTALLLVAILGSALTLSCKVNDYCLSNCGVEDGGGDAPGDGPTDGDGGAPTDGDGGPCVPTGAEFCDGKDNDCDGATDEGPLPTIGDPCDNQVGECAGGVKQCVAGAVTCTKNPKPEECNLKDDDCNGMTDENDPGGGAFCGTDQGECVRGTLHCNTQTGAIQCGLNCGTGSAIDCPVGGAMAPFGSEELCDGKDNDCDGNFDESVTQQALCGQGFCQCSGGPGADPNAGECQIGQLKCDGAGGTICAQITGQGPPQGPAFEACDNKDNDCDGFKDEDTDLNNDPTNCGACGTVCDLDHAFEGCSNGQCTVVGCENTFHDNNGNPTDGCEFGPCTIVSSVEVCNGIDDDCNPATGNNPPAPCGNCAENIPAPPNFCLTEGACAGASASCQGTLGFRCNYSGDVSQDASGNIVPETECDGIDNDCDGLIDEAQFGTPTDALPNLGAPCSEDGTLGTTLQQGVCRGTGTVQCPASGFGPARCVINVPGGSSSAEVCDNLDNNCNGQVDEGADTGNLAGQEWVDVPLTNPAIQIMKYEASRTDSDGTFQGTLDQFACSRQGVQPWTNIKQPDAETVCTNMGARLCSEAEWQLMCMPHTTYPAAGVPGPTTANATDFVFIEAEDFFANTTIGAPAAQRAWTRVSPTSLNGSSVMQVPENGFFVASAANALAQSSRMDYRLDLSASTNYFVWMRMRPPESPIRGSTVATQTLAPTAPSSTAVGDLVIVSTWSFVTNNGIPNHTLQSGFTQIMSQGLDDQSADARLSIAFRVATVAGAQPYQAYTSSAGTSFTGIVVLKAGSFDSSAIVNVSTSSATNNQGPNPPASGTAVEPSLVLAYGAYHFNGGTGNLVTSSNGVAEVWQTTGTSSTEFVVGQTTLPAGGAVNPARYTDASGVSGSAASTITIPLRGRTVYVGMTQGTTAGNATSFVGAAQSEWVVTPAFTTTTAGTYTFSIYTRDDGAMVDTIAVARQNTTSPTFDNAWAFATNPRTDQPTTCNTDAFDTTPGGTDQDEILATGSRPQCFADQTGANDGFDLTGNVKEWTAERAPNINPLRGGASNNETTGATCQINFTVADDDFFFPNVGFRCCRVKP